MPPSSFPRVPAAERSAQGPQRTPGGAGANRTPGPASGFGSARGARLFDVHPADRVLHARYRRHAHSRTALPAARTGREIVVAARSGTGLPTKITPRPDYDITVVSRSMMQPVGVGNTELKVTQRGAIRPYQATSQGQASWQRIRPVWNDGSRQDAPDSSPSSSRTAAGNTGRPAPQTHARVGRR